MMVAKGYTGVAQATDTGQIMNKTLPPIAPLLYLIRHHGLGLTSGSQTQGHGDKRISGPGANSYKKEKSFQEFLRISINVNLHIERRPKNEPSRVAGNDFRNLHRGGCAPR